MEVKRDMRKRPVETKRDLQKRPVDKERTWKRDLHTRPTDKLATLQQRVQRTATHCNILQHTNAGLHTRLTVL